MRKIVALSLSIVASVFLFSKVQAEELTVGKVAPDFSLPSADGDVTLSKFRGNKVVVVYFYPKDETPGCTTESCTFRDRYEDFKAAGAEVIGVSSDSVESHKGFASHHNLPFILVSDSDGSLRKLWGVPRAVTFPGRVTYVIDKAGKVAMVFNSATEPVKHVENALVEVKKLAAEPGSSSSSSSPSSSPATAETSGH